MIRDHLLAWLRRHATIKDADFVYRSWLEAGQPFDVIQKHCEAWLEEHWQLEDAVYVTKTLSYRRDLSLDSIARIVAWAGVHAGNDDAIFRLSRVSRSFTDQQFTMVFGKLVAKATDAVLANLISKTSFSKHERNACSILFANFAKEEYPHDNDWPAIVEAYCSGLRHGGIFLHFTGMPAKTWPTMLRSAFELKLLDPSKDGDAISHAIDLILQAMSEEELRQLAADGYFGGWQPSILDAASPEA